MLGKSKSMARVADALYDMAPFTRPEVIRLAGDVSLRLRNAPDSYLLVSLIGDEWAAGDVFIDPSTGEPATDAFSQRLMRDSVLPLARGKRDLDTVVMRILQRLVQKWSLSAEAEAADPSERAWSSDALQQLETRMNDPRPPLRP